jgi:uncharacterized protein YjbJ (UPF0337 family)
MNTDILKGKWKQMRGEVKKWWGDLTDDDLDRVEGERDKLIGRLQEPTGTPVRLKLKWIDASASTNAHALGSRRPDRGSVTGL